MSSDERRHKYLCLLCLFSRMDGNVPQDISPFALCHSYPFQKLLEANSGGCHGFHFFSCFSTLLYSCKILGLLIRDVVIRRCVFFYSGNWNPEFWWILKFDFWFIEFSEKIFFFSFWKLRLDFFQRSIRISQKSQFF